MSTWCHLFFCPLFGHGGTHVLATSAVINPLACWLLEARMLSCDLWGPGFPLDTVLSYAFQALAGRGDLKRALLFSVMCLWVLA